MEKESMFYKCGWVVILLIICSYDLVLCRVTVGVTINSYTNVNGTCYQESGSDRKCCDGPQRADCEDGDTCDTYFDICVGNMEANWGCKGAFLQTKPLNNTNAVYNVTQMEGESDFWTPGMGVFVFIRDSDNSGGFISHDHIDTLIQILKFTPDLTFGASSVHQYEWNGNNVELRISIQAWCSDGYYGTNCQKFCQDIQPISMCASSTGDLICQSQGALLLEFQSTVDNSVFPTLDIGVNRFMDEQVCQRNSSNVQYAMIESKTQTLSFEGYCGNHRVTPLEFESILQLKPDSVLRQYFKPDIQRGPVIKPQGYGEHVAPNVYVGIELLNVEHTSATSYDGDHWSGERKCCDVPSTTNCDTQTDTCDLQFSICIGEVSNGVCIGAVAISPSFDNTTSLYTCGPTLLDYTTGHTYVSHPMIGGMRLVKNPSNVKVIIKDIDLGGKSFDTVDVMNTSIVINPGPNITSATSQEVKLQNFVKLTLRLIFWCAPGFSGDLCTIVNGSSVNGTKYCEKGWSGDECDIPLDACHPNPCHNNGACALTASGSYNCTCDSGFTGHNCTQDINECDLYQICLNNGTCVNSYGAFNCKCMDGWTGLICSQKLPYCNPSPCVNGTCKPVYKPIAGYVCDCHQGWAGRNCDTPDVCDVTNCIHGRCTIVDGVHICMCIRGYSGKNCTEDIDECLARPCKNGGTCVNTIGDFNCSCPTGFSGKQCEILPVDCMSNECKNSGTCIKNGSHAYCLCAEGYTGAICDQLVDKCVSVKCSHGEKCEEKFDDFQCNCSKYWSGKTCDADVNECSLSVCQNSVKCINLPGSFYCECQQGWNGTVCNHDLNECLSNPCKNGGLCLNTNGSYTCQCKSGFTSKNCETQTTYCSNNTCDGHGSCSDGASKEICVCDSGFTGQHCETDIDECQLGICGGNSLNCANTPGSFNCSCKKGWQGANCSLDVNECKSTVTIPCSGNGFCTNKPGSFSCKCLTGFSGPLCSQFINSCNSIKCFNNATCEIRDEGPACVCANGWSGLKCETDKDECESFPCKNSGTCQNTDGSFFCSCYSGWSGSLCENDVNECLDQSKCSNKGTCSNVPGTYNCACQKGWQGMSCEVQSPDTLQGNVLAFSFEDNITLPYQQPMISYMYNFLTTYVCSGQEVILYVNSFMSNVVNITATCNGISVSEDTVTSGFNRVPNQTLPRLFPLPYKTFRQISTIETTTSAKTNSNEGLGTNIIIAIVGSCLGVLLVLVVIAFLYFKRRKPKDEDDALQSTPSSPYYKMDEFD